MADSSMERFRERRRRETRLPVATWDIRSYLLGAFGVVFLALGGFDLIFRAPSVWQSVLGWLLVLADVALVVLFVRWLALPVDREGVDRHNRGRDVTPFPEYEPNSIPGFGRTVLDTLRRIPPRRDRP